MEQPLYSFVLLHYNQQKTIRQALDSIFAQTWPHMELVVVDDGTRQFDKAAIDEYIMLHRRENLKRAVVLAPAENQGTVRALNCAMEETRGDYIHVFAADDALTDTTVAETFMGLFARGDRGIIAANALMYDAAMEKVEASFKPEHYHREMGAMSAKQQLEVSAQSCPFAFGASCFSRALYQQYGPFNEDMRLIEDWPFYFKLNLAGVKIHTADFFALNHRAGGVSHNIEAVEPPSVMMYREDVLRVKEQLVLPNLRLYSYDTQVNAVRQYRWQLEDLKRHNGVWTPISFWKIVSYSPVYLLLHLWNTLVQQHKKVMLAGMLIGLLSFFAFSFSQVSFTGPSTAFLSGLYQKCAVLFVVFSIVGFILFLGTGIFALLLAIKNAWARRGGK